MSILLFLHLLIQKYEDLFFTPLSKLSKSFQVPVTTWFEANVEDRRRTYADRCHGRDFDCCDFVACNVGSGIPSGDAGLYDGSS